MLTRIRLAGPVIVGGMGGSGSRPLVRVLMELRHFMAPRRNVPQEDALDVVEFDYKWTPPFIHGQADVEQMRREFDEDVLPKLLPGGRWGWKHNPSAHLLPFYLERFPDLRFIHIIRDGRDVAVGRAGGAAHTRLLGRALLDGDPTPVTLAHPVWKGKAATLDGHKEGTPERIAAFWARSNRDIADFGERVLGDGYLRLRLEDISAQPQEAVRRIARFLGVDDPPARAARLVEWPSTIGRWRDHEIDIALPLMGDELVRFGYVDPPAVAGTPVDLYLHLLRQALAGRLSRDFRYATPLPDGRLKMGDSRSPGERPPLSWPVDAETMLSLARLDNVRACVEDILDRGVPGDLIETGVWRGGTTIFMRGILAAYGVTDRRVWVADSFQGPPAPDAWAHPADEGSRLHTRDHLAVPKREVRQSFRRYDLLDDRVVFLRGWFRDTLPTLEDERFALVRLDGDMYGSTMDALEHLYPRLSTGGYLIVDDYAIDSCREAVHDYRSRHGIDEPIERIDALAAFWRKLP